MFALPRPGSESGSVTPEMGELLGELRFEETVERVDLSSNGSLEAIGGIDMGWQQDLREMDYLALLDGMGQQGLSGIST